MTPFNATPCEDREAALLENVDLLVEAGLPRELATRATKRAFDELDHFAARLSNISKSIGPNLRRPISENLEACEVSLTLALITGGVYNFTKERKEWAGVTVKLLAKLLHSTTPEKGI